MTMQANIGGRLNQLASADDPKKAIFDAVGDLSKEHVYSNRVLLGVYIAPAKTAGGIWRPDQNIREDVWQSVLGVVLKKGPLAFADDTDNVFAGQNVEVGDWVLFQPGNTRRLQINGTDCRLIQDTLIDMKISDPSIITHQKR